jgi:general L-amino acid transport system ATP-binding protein
MGFVSGVAYRVFFMDFGQIVEENRPEEYLESSQHERIKFFFSQILQLQV